MTIAISDTEFVRHPDRYKEAAKHETVAVTRDGAPEIYLLSSAEYDHYTTLKRRESEAFSLKELPEAVVRAIVSAPIDSEFDRYDDEAPR
jgi:PHD/YefM family antitoxin component YafN of YafNO toxin-antitoxin module